MEQFFKLPDSDDLNLYDNNPPPLDQQFGIRPLGTLKTLSSHDIASSIVGIGMETLDRDTYDPAPLYDPLCVAGCKWVRLQTGWIKCEKTAGVYDFAWLDAIVDNLLQRGIQPWFNTGFGHPIHTPVPAYEELFRQSGNSPANGMVRGYVGEVPLYHGPRAMAAWKNYLAAMAEHFSDRVRHYEIWNEPDVHRVFWRHLGQPVHADLKEELRRIRIAEDYVDFVKESADALRKTLPQVKVIATISHPVSDHVRVAGIRRLADWVDIISYHNYANTPEAENCDKVAFFRSHLSVPGKTTEFWQGEAGRATHPHHSGCYITSEYVQAKYILRRLLCDFQTGMKVSSIFTASDLRSYYPDGSDQEFGIFKADPVRPKLGFFAFQAMATLLAEAESTSRMMISGNLINGNMAGSRLNYQFNSVAFLRHEVPVFALYLPESVEISVPPIRCEVKISGELGYRFREPVLIDPLRHKVYAIDREIVKYPDWAYGSAIIAPYPVADYPVFMTERSAIELERA